MLSSVDEYLVGVFLFWAVMNNAVIKIPLKVLVWTCFYFSLVKTKVGTSLRLLL